MEARENGEDFGDIIDKAFSFLEPLRNLFEQERKRRLDAESKYEARIPFSQLKRERLIF